MLAYHFKTTYSEQDLIDAVQKSQYIEVPRGYWNKLRMTQSNLVGVFGAPQAQGSIACNGVKQWRERHLVMIGYDMRLGNNIDWNQARRNFQKFLARHLNIAESSVDIEGIIWDESSCWYITNATPALIQATLIDEAIKSSNNSNDWIIKAAVPIGARFGIGLLRRIIKK